MTDHQSRAPQCPHGHGPMRRDNERAWPWPLWVCNEVSCEESGTPSLLKQEYQRGRYEGEMSFGNRLAKAEQRAEQAQKRAQLHFDRERQFEARVRELEAERDNWIETARLYTQNAEHHQAERDRLWEALESLYQHALVNDYIVEEQGGSGLFWKVKNALDSCEPDDCSRCGNPQHDCQCHGSKAMEHERSPVRQQMREASEQVAQWSPEKQARMQEAVHGDSLAQPMPTKPIESTATDRVNDDAPHGRCWCGVPLEEYEDINLSRKPESKIILRCSAHPDDHRPCPGCGQWVEWLISGGITGGSYRHIVDNEQHNVPCPGPAPYGYCRIHPNVPKRHRAPLVVTGHIYCPQCEEEANNA